jgi:hypothetical protein
VEINLNDETVRRINSDGPSREIKILIEQSSKETPIKNELVEKLELRDLAELNGKTDKLKEEIIYTCRRPVFQSRVNSQASVFYDLKGIEADHRDKDSMFIDP